MDFAMMRDIQYRAWFCAGRGKWACTFARPKLAHDSIRGHSTCLCGSAVHWIEQDGPSHGGDVVWDGFDWKRVEEPA